MSKADAAHRKQLQRERARASGLVKVEVWVAEDQAQKVRDFAKSLPLPTAPKDPAQLDLVDRIQAEVDSGVEG